jgi:hypothetical protein
MRVNCLGLLVLIQLLILADRNVLVAPAFVAQSRAAVWYARCAIAEPSLLPETMPWYAHKRHPSFVDMLSALRKLLWQHRISPNLRFSPRVRELIETVFYGLFAA